MKRREFLHRATCAAGALSVHASAFACRALALPALPRKFQRLRLRQPLAKPASRPAALPWVAAPLASAIIHTRPLSASRDSLTCSSTATTTACAFFRLPPILTAGHPHVCGNPQTRPPR